jgi:hypothetical protein
MWYQSDRWPRSCASRSASVILVIIVAGLVSPSYGDDAPQRDAQSSNAHAGTPASQVEARLTDGSVLKIRLIDSHVRLKTEYGELRIPTSDIRRIDFATRLDDELARAIAAAVVDLRHDDYEVRERATQRLAAYGAAAYPALLQAAEDDDLEVVHRAEKLIAAIRETLPAEQYEVRADDVVQTAKSRIAGQLDAATLLVHTEPFGKQELKLTSLRSVRLASGGDAENKLALPDPGTLSNYQGQAGKQLQFRVTGGVSGVQFGGGFAGGAVWGSDVYTLDSALAVAAVHAGVVKSGETAVVAVTILGPQNSFAGSTRNGVTTSPWGQFPGGFKFIRGEDIP